MNIDFEASVSHIDVTTVRGSETDFTLARGRETLSRVNLWCARALQCETRHMLMSNGNRNEATLS
jgi:hypothetical protein